MHEVRFVLRFGPLLASAAAQHFLSSVAALISLRQNKLAHNSSERLHTQVI